MTLRASSAKLAVDTRGDVAAASAALADVTAAGRQALEDLRHLLAVLGDPDAIDAEVLLADPNATIEDAVTRLSDAGVSVDVELDPRLVEAALVTRVTVARVIQEALTNVLKHAGPGTSGRVTVATCPAGGLRLRVVNGPAVAQRSVLPLSGHGLAGMRDRVDLLGGKLVAGPTPDGGWSVTVDLPGRRHR
jgi:signal transduction histidine kinase